MDIQVGNIVRVFKKPVSWCSDPNGNSDWKSPLTDLEFPFVGTVLEVVDMKQYTAIKIGDYGFSLESLQDVCEIISKQYYKIMSNTNAEKFLDADGKALMEAGFLNTDLSLNNAGLEAQKSILMDMTREALVKAAKEKVKAEKAAKK